MGAVLSRVQFGLEKNSLGRKANNTGNALSPLAVRLDQLVNKSIPSLLNTLRDGIEGRVSSVRLTISPITMAIALFGRVFATGGKMKPRHSSLDDEPTLHAGRRGRFPHARLRR
jgi:hypothetical protein